IASAEDPKSCLLLMATGAMATIFQIMTRPIGRPLMCCVDSARPPGGFVCSGFHSSGAGLNITSPLIGGALRGPDILRRTATAHDPYKTPHGGGRRDTRKRRCCLLQRLSPVLAHCCRGGCTVGWSPNDPKRAFDRIT